MYDTPKNSLFVSNHLIKYGKCLVQPIKVALLKFQLSDWNIWLVRCCLQKLLEISPLRESEPVGLSDIE